MTAILSVRELTKCYSQAKEKIEVLKNLNLEVAKGETVAVIGQSGSLSLMPNRRMQ